MQQPLILSRIMANSNVCQPLRLALRQYCDVAPKVEKSLLAKLRKETGFAFSNCRKALVTHNNDFDKAVEWLNAEAAKEGWSKAIKLQNRPMSQGLLGIQSDERSGLLLEVNCETDFVAKNEKFLHLVSRLTNMCFDTLRNKTEKTALTSQSLNALTHSGSTLQEIIAREVANIGENIQARRAVYLSVPEPDNYYLANYVHTGGLNHADIDGCRFGKYASLIVMKPSTHSEIATCGNQLGQHIVGMNPTTVGILSDEPSQEETQTIPQEEATSQDANVEVERSKKPEDEGRLLFQEFLLQPDELTKDWLSERGLEVVDFVRYGVGEDYSEV